MDTLIWPMGAVHMAPQRWMNSSLSQSEDNHKKFDIETTPFSDMPKDGPETCHLAVRQG